jgi:hypothetical protein
LAQPDRRLTGPRRGKQLSALDAKGLNAASKQFHMDQGELERRLDEFVLKNAFWQN